MMIIKKEINALRAEVEALVKLNNEMEAYRAVKAFALEHDFRAISDMVFDAYWDEGLSELIKIERACIDEINKALDEIKREIHKAFTKEVKTALVDTFKVSSVEDFLLYSVVDAEADELAFDFGCLGYDGEFLNKELFALEEETVETVETVAINKLAADIIEEQQEIKSFEADAYAAGFDVVEYNARTIESDNRLDILYSRILAVAEGIDQVALLIRVDTPAKYRRVIINTLDASVKNTFSLKAPFKEKVKRSRHKMDLQIKNKQGFEIAWLACMVHDIIDDIERDTYDGLFVSHKFDQGNRDTSYEPDNVSRAGVELLPKAGGINGQINSVHKFLNDAQNLYILEGKDHKLIEQLIQLKNKNPQAAKDLACKLRKRTFISSDIKKNVWKF